MFFSKRSALTPMRAERDPFGMLRQFIGEFDRAFDEPFWGWRQPFMRTLASPYEATWSPAIEVFERDNRLFTKVELPGLKKDDIKVEITDGYLAISGERKKEFEEEKENLYRCERAYGAFYRAVPLPEGVTLDDVKATFVDGVLEVSVPVPAIPKPKSRKVEIEEGVKTEKHAA